MPFRLWETDSAIPFEATYSGYYYLEVLEWGDWDEDSEGAGGSNYDYALGGYSVTQLDPEPENNDVDDLVEYLDGEEAYIYYLDPFAESYLSFYGDMDEAGDVDLYRVTIEEYDSETDSTEYDGLYYGISFWDMPMDAWNPSLAMYTEDGELLAETGSPAYSVEQYQYYNYSGFYYDFGLMVYLEPGTYYIAVSEGDDSGDNGDTGYRGSNARGSDQGWRMSADAFDSIGTFYAGILGGYYDSLATWEGVDGDSNTAALGGSLVMEESTNTEGYFYTRAAGSIESADDLLDAWVLDSDDVGTLAGQYLNVNLQAESYGSKLDAAVSVYDQDMNLLETASSNDWDAGADPVIIDLELPDTDKLYIVVEPEALGADELSNNYFFFASVYSEPNM
jgi:hypothetical protein